MMHLPFRRLVGVFVPASWLATALTTVAANWPCATNARLASTLVGALCGRRPRAD